MEDFALKGYFTEFGSQSWDILRFKTLGLELTATKAASKKSKDKKDEKGKDKTKDKNDNETKEQSQSDPTGNKSTNEPQQAQDDEAKPESIIDPATILQAKLTSTKPSVS